MGDLLRYPQHGDQLRRDGNHESLIHGVISFVLSFGVDDLDLADYGNERDLAELKARRIDG